MLDISEVGTFADYFVICSGESQRQINAIIREVDKVLGQAGVDIHHREGKAETGWVLLDYTDVIVQVFDLGAREYYGLEQLWSKAKPVIRIQ
jgi:ribosome-associated protein|tara:strand:- start:104 stop:379 length:276 start_codon:yes stop_codon:yes gene_type:complete